MKFEPKSAREAAATQYSWLLPASTYDFEIVEAVDGVSSKGNDMATIMLRIENADGKEFKVRDYIVATEGMAYKVRNFAESIGMLAAYESGDMPASAMLGKTGRAKIAIEPEKDAFPAKNFVRDYLKAGVSAPAMTKTPPLDDDEIPFS